MPSRKFTKSDYEFIKNLKVDSKDKEKLTIIADKIHGVYFNSKNETLELKDDVKNYYNTLTRTIKERRKVKINYYSYKKGNQDRIIRPLDMFLYNTSWRRAAFCELKNDLRHFELKRINKIELLSDLF